MINTREMIKYDYYDGTVRFYAGKRGVNPHRISNLLGAVLNCVELLQSNLDKKEEIKVVGILNNSIKEIGILTGVWIEDNERIELE